MSTSVATVEVDVPVEVAYDQWSRLEMFPAFLEDVDSVTSTADGQHHWVTRVGGVVREFDSKIIDRIPHRLMAWRTVDGLRHHGAVRFARLARGRTNITVNVEFEPTTPAEQVADRLGLVRRRLDRGLRHFKQYVEARPTGAHLNAAQ